MKKYFKLKKLIFILVTIYCSLVTVQAQDYHKIDSLKKVLHTFPVLNGTEGDTLRMNTCIDIGKLFQNVNLDSAIAWFSLVADTTFSEASIKQNQRKYYFNATALRYLGLCFYTQGHFQKAQTCYNKSLIIYNELGDKTGISNCLNNIGGIYKSQGDYNKAILNYEKSLEIFKELKNKLGIGFCFNNLGNVYQIQGNFPVAITYFESAVKIFEGLKYQNGISSALLNLSNVFYIQGNYPKAIFYYEETLKIFEESENLSAMSICYMNIGNVYESKDDYPKAIMYYERSLKISEMLGDKVNFSSCLMGLGNVFYGQGNYEKAILFQEKSLKIEEELGEKDGISLCLLNIGNAYSEQSDFTKAILNYKKSLKIFKEIEDKSGISLTEMGLGLVFYKQGDYIKAKTYYDESLKILEELGDKSEISLCFMGLGSIYSALGNYSTAIEYYKKSENLSKELGLLDDLANNYLMLSEIYVKQKEFNQASLIYIKSVQIERKLIQDNFNILSEKEKEMFIKETGNVFNTLNEFASIAKSDSILAQCYDNTLLLKGLLQHSSRSIMDAVSKSSDTNLIKTFWRFKQLRTKIAELYSIPIKEREVNLDSLENIANDEERKLALLSKDYSEIKKQFNYKWENVQTALRKDEAAIEFVKINCSLLLKDIPVKIDTIKNSKGVRDSVVYKKEKNDSTFYAAFIVRPGYKSPKMISLFDEKELEKILNKMTNNRGLQILEQPATKEKSRELYDLIWTPLEVDLKGVKTIYYSPDGLLCKVSFASMTSPDNKFLFDLYNLKTLYSTREIFSQNKPLQINSDFTCSIYGGIQYDLDENKLITNAKKYKPEEKFDLVLNEKERSIETKRGGEWNYLKGTLLEAETIKKEFENQKVATNFFSGENANEESFKSLSSKSPTIIHIATHGFYIADNKNKNSDLEAGNNFKFNKNPLFRSGLIMAGANRVWLGNDAIDGVDDGILTAFEVSNLDLSNTKLVVLSACETGLGEIRGSEGVYGLQRAFKMAGVQYIIMTLWEIRDEVTVEFMETFYKQWLSGKDIYAAFKYAQDEMRKKYEANYWAAFVLIE